jgi:phage-related protein
MVLGKISSAASNMYPMAKAMGKKAFVKGAKTMGKTAKSMASAGGMGGLRSALSGIKDIFNAMLSPLQVLNPLFKIIAGIIRQALLPVIQMLMPYIQMAVKWLNKNRKAILMFLNPIKLLGMIWKRLTSDFKKIGKGLSAIWNNIVAPVFTALMTAVRVIGDVFKAAIDVLFGAFDAVGDAFDAVFDAARGVINGFVGAINAVIGAINKIPGVNLDKLPTLDTGGEILETGLAVVHKNERVLTDEENKRLKEGKTKEPQITENTVNININGGVIADERSMHKLVSKIERSMWRTM